MELEKEYDVFRNEDEADRELKKQVSTSELRESWANADFGDVNPRDIIKDTLLKRACGYGTGRFAVCICVDLKLLTKVNNVLTQKGKYYLYEAVK